MWLFGSIGKNKETSYKPVQRQVSITTTQEGPADRGDRYSVVSSPNGFPSTSVIQEDDSASSFEQFNTSNSTHREPLDPCTWSSVSSPGFATRIVNQANSSPLKEFNNGNNSPLNRSYFSGSPNRHLKLGQLPYSSWRRQSQSSPLHFPPSPNRRSRGRYSDNGTVFVRIAPVDPEKIVLSPIPGSPSSNLPNLNADNFGRSPPNGGLGGIPQTVLSAKFQRLWPSTNPIDRSLRMAPSPNSPSPGILEALANRKRSRVTDVYVDKTTTPMRSAMINTDDCPNKSSKRVKFLSDERNNRSLSMVPLHNLPSPDDVSMTSESILEQMNQTEKRFLPDEDPPASVRMLQKKKSPGSPRSAMQASPFKKKKSPSSISIVDKDPKNDRFCTCTECYEEAAGVSSLLQNNTSLTCIDRSMSQPGSSRKSVTFNLTHTEQTTPTKSVVSTGTETDIMAKEVIVRKSASSSGGIINMDMYKTDKIRRAERLRKILCMDEKEENQEIPAAEQLRESAGATGASTLSTSLLGNNTVPFTGFGLNKDTTSNSDIIDGPKKDEAPAPATTFSFPQDKTTTSTTAETKEAPKAAGFSFGLTAPGAISGSSSKEPENSSGATIIGGSESGVQIPIFGATSTEPSGNPSTTTSTAPPAFSFGGPKDPLLSSSKEPTVTTSSFSPGGFSFGSAISASAATTTTQPSSNTATVSSTSTVPSAGFSFGSSTGSTGSSTTPGSALFSTGLNQQSSSPLTSSLFGGLINPAKDSATPEPSKETTTGSSTLPTTTLASSAPFSGFGLNKFDTTSSSSVDDRKNDVVPSSTFSFSQDKPAANVENKDVPKVGGFNFSSSSPFPSLSSKETESTLNAVASEGSKMPMFGSTASTESSNPLSTTTANPAPAFSFGGAKDSSSTSSAVTTTSSFSPAGFSFGSASSGPTTQSLINPVTVPSSTTAPTGGFSFGSNNNATPSSTSGSTLFNSGTNQQPTSQPAPLFGGLSSSSSPFGQSTPTPTVPSTQTSNLFNTNSTANVFGQSQNPSAPSSAPTFGNPSGVNLYGQPTASSPNVTFGQSNNNPSSTGTPNVSFGQSTNNQAGSTPSAFGQANNNQAGTTLGAFGQTPNQSSTTSTFGQTNQGSTPSTFGQATNQGNTAGAFGQSTNTAGATAFGQPANNSVSGALFKPNTGFGAAAPNNSFNSFGQQPQANPTPNTFNSGAFNFGSATSNPTTPSSSIFGSAPVSGPPTFGSPAPVTSPPPFGAATGTQSTAFGSPAPTFGAPTTATNSSAFGSAANTNPPAFGSQITNPSGFGTSGGGAFNFQTPGQQAVSPQSGGFSFANSNPNGNNNNTNNNNNNNNSQGLFQFGQQAQSAQGTTTPAFGSAAPQNPPAFGSQMTTQPGFGTSGGGAFNFQTPSQTTTQPAAFSFGTPNTNNNNNNNNPQGLFQYGQQPAPQPQQGGFNFTPQTNFTAGMPPQQGGAQMFSLGSTNTTPSARRRDARPRRYR